jgi:hypothetical protein
MAAFCYFLFRHVSLHINYSVHKNSCAVQEDKSLKILNSSKTSDDYEKLTTLLSLLDFFTLWVSVWSATGEGREGDLCFSIWVNTTNLSDVATEKSHQMYCRKSQIHIFADLNNLPEMRHLADLRLADPVFLWFADIKTSASPQMLFSLQYIACSNSNLYILYHRERILKNQLLAAM